MTFPRLSKMSIWTFLADALTLTISHLQASSPVGNKGPANMFPARATLAEARSRSAPPNVAVTFIVISTRVIRGGPSPTLRPRCRSRAPSRRRRLAWRVDRRRTRAATFRVATGYPGRCSRRKGPDDLEGDLILTPGRPDFSRDPRGARVLHPLVSSRTPLAPNLPTAFRQWQASRR